MSLPLSYYKSDVYTPSLGIGQPVQMRWVLPSGGASAGTVGDRRHKCEGLVQAYTHLERPGLFMLRVSALSFHRPSVLRQHDLSIL